MPLRPESIQQQQQQPARSGASSATTAASKLTATDPWTAAAAGQSIPNPTTPSITNSPGSAATALSALSAKGLLVLSSSLILLLGSPPVVYAEAMPFPLPVDMQQQRVLAGAGGKQIESGSPPPPSALEHIPPPPPSALEHIPPPPPSIPEHHHTREQVGGPPPPPGHVDDGLPAVGGTGPTVPLAASASAATPAFAFVFLAFVALLTARNVSSRIRQKFRQATNSVVGTVGYPISNISARTITMAWASAGGAIKRTGPPPTTAVAGFTSLSSDNNSGEDVVNLEGSDYDSDNFDAMDVDLAAPTGFVPNLEVTSDTIDLSVPEILACTPIHAAAAQQTQQTKPAPAVLVKAESEESGDATIAKKAESEENLAPRVTSVPKVQFPLALPIVAGPGVKPVLALDLDETLIHSSLVPRRPADFWIEVIQGGDMRTREVFWVYKRPGVDAFLAAVSQAYTVMVFTAGIREYASQILDVLDPTGTIFAARLYRDACTEMRGPAPQSAFAKDMTRVCTDMRRIMLVDNTPGCFALQPANGLPIKSWYTDTTDTQLFRLQDFLLSVANVDDLRLVLPEWRM
ncbi:hypothetical protein H9P43_009577 [Blastocladiella emersonii ATCC 22665]|nr:hypothetical protein H9P43_009577 [Blastocladiella emersonii ATCC 22665]